MLERRDWQDKGSLMSTALDGSAPLDLFLWSFYLYLVCLVSFSHFQFRGFVSVCLTARRMRYKINLYPCFVVFPPPWQYMSVISRPVWFQAFQWMPPFANFRLLFFATQCRPLALCVSFPLSPLCSPPHTHTGRYTIYPNVLHFKTPLLSPCCFVQHN